MSFTLLTFEDRKRIKALLQREIDYARQIRFIKAYGRGAPCIDSSSIDELTERIERDKATIERLALDVPPKA